VKVRPDLLGLCCGSWVACSSLGEVVVAPTEESVLGVARQFFQPQDRSVDYFMASAQLCPLLLPSALTTELCPLLLPLVPWRDLAPHSGLRFATPRRARAWAGRPSRGSHWCSDCAWLLACCA